MNTRTITRPGDEAPYLERTHVCGPCSWSRARWTRWLPFTVYLHRILISDPDEDLHNHPWSAVSLILRGGYLEERRVGAWRVHAYQRRPGHLVVIRRSTYHRITLRRPATTLFLVWRGFKPPGGQWGFWNRFTGRTRPAK